MKPYIHALSSAKKFGGKWEDYIVHHDWFDQSKAHFADARHRSVLHSSFGIYLCEQVFGTTMVNSDGKTVSIRDIGEQHVQEDMKGVIPTVDDYLSEMEYKPWMNGETTCPSHRKIEAHKKTTFTPFKERD